MTGQTTTRRRSPGKHRKARSRLVRWRRRVWPSLNLIMLPVGVGAPASAAGGARLVADHAQDAGVTLPVTSCASLAGMNFTRVPDAPGQVASATVVSDLVLGKPMSFRDVRGSFAPQTHFEIKLPKLITARSALNQCSHRQGSATTDG